MIVFTAIPFSPWSEKARWALDHHRVAYREDRYVPLLGEIALRLRMRAFGGLVTVPVLHDGARWISDSFEIARYAERAGSGAPLFPPDKIAEIAAWNRRSDAALAAGRAARILASEDDPDVALAALPDGVPPAVRRLLVPVAKLGMRAFIAKYRMREGAGSHDAVMTREFDALSKALSGKRYLIDDAFSYADIAMAVSLQGVAPVDERYMPKVPGVDRGAPADDFKRRYPDLVAWRDDLYARHRRPAARA